MWILGGRYCQWKTEVLRERPSQCHYVHYKSYWPEMEGGPPQGEAGDKPSIPAIRQTVNTNKRRCCH